MHFSIKSPPRYQEAAMQSCRSAFTTETIEYEFPILGDSLSSSN